MRKLVRERII